MIKHIFYSTLAFLVVAAMSLAMLTCLMLPALLLFLG